MLFMGKYHLAICILISSCWCYWWFDTLVPNTVIFTYPEICIQWPSSIIAKLPDVEMVLVHNVHMASYAVGVSLMDCRTWQGVQQLLLANMPSNYGRWTQVYKNPMDFIKYIWKTKYHSELIEYLIIEAYVWRCYRTDTQNWRRKDYFPC